MNKRWPAVLAVVGIVVGGMVFASPANANATKVWQKTYNTGESGGTGGKDVAADAGNGNVYVLNTSGCCLFSNMALVAYSKTGTKLWSALSSAATPDIDRPKAVTVDPSTHDVIITGTRGNNMVTQAYSATGTRLWSIVHRTTGTTFTPVDLAVDGHGRVIVASTSNNSGGNENYFTIAYQLSDGTRAWAMSYEGTPLGADEVAGIAADPGNDQVYVTGGSFGHNFLELTTVAYNGATGAQLWAARDTGNDDTAVAVAVDTGSHHVIATAATALSPLVFRTFAFDASGNPLWNAEYDSPQHVNASPEAATVDSSNGQVYVAGEQRTPSGGSQTVLVGYSSSGTQLFAHVEHTGINDMPLDVAVDVANHNVYVAAEREDSTGRLEFATFADTSAGARVWQAAHQTPFAVGIAGPSAIAVDPTAGQVYVTGAQSNDNGNNDSITLAYKV